MSKQKHTPGPWVVSSSVIVVALSDPGCKMITNTMPIGVESLNVPFEECEANAHLIAAAPDLLAACKRMKSRLETGRPAHGDLAVVDAAIDKAEEV